MDIEPHGQQEQGDGIIVSLSGISLMEDQAIQIVMLLHCGNAA